jgi:hypothetical protein
MQVVKMLKMTSPIKGSEGWPSFNLYCSANSVKMSPKNVVSHQGIIHDI